MEGGFIGMQPRLDDRSAWVWAQRALSGKSGVKIECWQAVYIWTVENYEAYCPTARLWSSLQGMQYTMACCLRGVYFLILGILDSTLLQL
jgi:hypothetical protein